MSIKTEIPKIIQEIDTKNVGDKIKFGKYNWIILEIDKIYQRVLMITEESIAERSFGSSTDYAKSEIRKWLNNEFINESFDADERRFIIKSGIENNMKEDIFLLNSDDVLKYIIILKNKYIGGVISIFSSSFISSYWLRSSKNTDYVQCFSASGTIYERIPSTNCLIRPALWLNIEI